MKKPKSRLTTVHHKILKATATPATAEQIAKAVDMLLYRVQKPLADLLVSQNLVYNQQTGQYFNVAYRVKIVSSEIKLTNE